MNLRNKILDTLATVIAFLALAAPAVVLFLLGVVAFAIVVFSMFTVVRIAVEVINYVVGVLV